jgi:hypothetical protein
VLSHLAGPDLVDVGGEGSRAMGQLASWALNRRSVGVVLGWQANHSP